MEIRRMSIWLAFFAVAVVVQCSEAHTTQKRAVDDDEDYADPSVQNDEGSDDEAQNDAEGGDDEEPEVNANIETIPSYYNVTVGKTVRLECKTVPSNDYTVVQWSRNNTMYFIGTQKPHSQELRQYIQDPRFTIAENSTDLLVRDVRAQDSGVYKCELLQKHPRSIEHNVVVLESPRIIKFTATNNGRVVEGADVLLTCEVAGSPPPQIVWSRDVDNGNKRLEEKDGEFTLNSVTLRSVQREQAGKYYCYAFNSAGSNQQEIRIVVVGKPRVHVSRPVINSDIGVTAVLQCSAHDDAPPHIRWYKDGRLLEDGASQFDLRTSGAHSNLTLTPQTDADFGTYTCEAENSMGSHNRSIDLVQRPVIEELDSDGPKLTWTVHSHQPLEEIELQIRNLDGGSEWRSIQVPVPETRTHQYEIVYVIDDKSLEPGKYEATVQVKNSKTWSEHSQRAQVEIEAQPQYIQHASVYRGSGYSIRPTETILATALMYLLVRMF